MADPGYLSLRVDLDALALYGECPAVLERGACGWTADTITRTLIEDGRAFRSVAEPFDDLSLLVVERKPAAV